MLCLHYLYVYCTGLSPGDIYTEINGAYADGICTVWSLPVPLEGQNPFLSLNLWDTSPHGENVTPGGSFPPVMHLFSFYPAGEVC